MVKHVCDVHRILYGDTTLRECEYCSVCLHPQQLVLTDRGYMPISFIKEGWKVLSHDGRFHKVLSVLEREYEGEMVKVEVHGSPFPIIVTPDHLLLAGKIEHSWKARYVNGGHVAFISQISWMEAKDIKKGYCMFIPSSKKVGNRYWHMGGAFYTMVKSVERMHYKGKVYDLQVEGAHSFVGPSCTYHNCHAWICNECKYSPRRILAFLKSKGISWEAFKKWLMEH